MSLDEKSDDELVRAFKSGDIRAFDAIVQRFQDRIYRLAAVWLYDDQYAADVAQEVFVRSYKGLRRFRFRSAPFTWLYRTTKNVCSEFNRRRTADPIIDEPVDTNSSPDNILDSIDAARRIRTLIERLPERQREVVMLRMFEDLSVREAAAAMGCREGTVKALLHKATSTLRQQAQLTGFTDE